MNVWQVRLKVLFDDWRIRAVGGAIGLSFAVTALAYLYGIGLNPSTHFGSVFASWVGGLALFLVAGSVVALVSLVRPENESFDSRARILFRRQTGKHIDYIVSKIKEALEHYSEITEVKISIRSYNAQEKKYRISSTTDVKIRSYLDDVETVYNSHIRLKDVTSPPLGGNSNRVVFARVAGTVVVPAEDFVDAIERPIVCRVERANSCDLNAMTEFWIAATTEHNTNTPRRYTQTLRLRLENVLDDYRPLNVKFSTDGKNWEELQIPHGMNVLVVEAKDLLSGVPAYDYMLLEP